MRNFFKSLRRWVISSSTGRESEPFLLSVSETSAVVIAEGEANDGLLLSKRSCSTRPSSTETMIAASRVSLKTIKKMGTENKFLPILGRLEVK